MSFLRNLFQRGASAERAAEDAPPSDLPVAEDAPPAGAPVAEEPPSQAAGDQAWWEESAPLPDVAVAGSANGTDTPPTAEPPGGEVEPPAEREPLATIESSTRPLDAGATPAPVAPRSRRGLAAAALRDIGRVRSINQDSLFALTATLPRGSIDVTMGLFIVADGMGGHDGGEIASRLAVSTVVRHVLAELVLPALEDGAIEALQPLIVAAIQEANRAVWEHARTIGSDMGTTCTVVLLLGQALYIGHVGDTRAYLVTPTGMRLLTNDHSTVGRLIQLGQLDPSEAREHPLRSQLYRTIGQTPEVLVDFVYQPLGDATHLLLASDGLWGLIDEELLLDAIEHAAWPHDACHELIARANLAGGDDNISAVVVSLPS